MPSIDAELTQHAAFLTALARRLTASEQEADDLVQDTFVAALRSRADRIDAPRNWLASVLRRGAFRAKRAQSNRTAREREVAQSEASAGHLGSQRDGIEIGQRLLGHVRALESPYSEVLFQRYYEGLMPREIAERAGCSTGTVKTRLARALAKLRERMDADDPRGREAWFGVALALGRGAAAPLEVSGAASGLALGPLLAFALLLCAGALGWLATRGLRAGAGTAQADQVARITPVEPASTLARIEARDEDGERRPEDAPETSETATPLAEIAAVSDATGEGVAGVVVDVEGEPVPGVTVLAHWRDQGAPEETTITDATGRFIFPTRTDPQRFEATLAGWHFLNSNAPGRNLRWELDEATILMARIGTLRIEAVHSDGSPVEDLPVSVIADSVGLLWPGFSRFNEGANGTLLDGALTLDVPAGVPLIVYAASGRFGAQRSGLAVHSMPATPREAIIVRPGSDSTLRIVVATDVEVHITLVDPDGDPAGGVDLTFSDPDVSWQALLPRAATTDEHGRATVRITSFRDRETLRVSGSRPYDPGEPDQVERTVDLSGSEPLDITIEMLDAPRVASEPTDGGEPGIVEFSFPADTGDVFKRHVIRYVRVAEEAGVSAEALSNGAFHSADASDGFGWWEACALPGASVMSQRVKGRQAELALAPGIYCISISGDLCESRAHNGNTVTVPVPLTRIETGLVEVKTGRHGIAVALGPAVIWDGRVLPRAGRPPIPRAHVAVCDAAARPMEMGNRAYSQRYFPIGWRGSVYVEGIPPGEHEVWVGTLAELEAGTPRVRTRVLFEGERSALVVTY